MPCSQFNAFTFLIETHALPNAHSLLPSQLYLDHSHCLVLAPATLAALPSTRAIPNRDVFYVARPARSIETRSPPGSLAPTLVTLPSMSRVPRAPFFLLTFDLIQKIIAPVASGVLWKTGGF